MPSWQPVLKSGDDMMAIAAQFAMIAVVQQDDVTVAVSANRNAREPPDQALGGLGSNPSIFSTT